MPAPDATRNSSTANTSKPESLFGYEVLHRIGHGWASSVYLVRQPEGQERFALKHLVGTGHMHQLVEQLKNELEVSQHLNHPGLRRGVGIRLHHTLLRRVNEAALVMEVAGGLSLHERPLPDLPGVVACFIKAARALEAMHKAGYVHCGLRPHEILVDNAGGVKVIDYGEAVKVGTVVRPAEGARAAARAAQSAAHAAGHYAAPEVARREPITARADVFGLGATLYEVLCRKPLPPVVTQQTSDTSFLVKKELASPHAVDDRVPPTLSDLVMHCVRGNPLKRPADMAEVAWRLEVIHHTLTRGSTPTDPAAAVEFAEPDDD